MLSFIDVVSLVCLVIRINHRLRWILVLEELITFQLYELIINLEIWNVMTLLIVGCDIYE